jgi:DNA-binding NarL/FixJ family response regulator
VPERSPYVSDIEKWTVLIAEDALAYADRVEAALGRAAIFEVVARARDGAEAVAIADAHQPDLVVLSARLPILDGLDALPELLRSSPGSRVVVCIEGDGDADGDELLARARGATVTVSKAEPIRVVVDALWTVLLGEVAGQ